MNSDLRSFGHQVLDNTEGELTSLVILATYGETKGCTMIAGYMSKIEASLTNAMSQKPEFRKAFESAWIEATKEEIDSN